MSESPTYDPTEYTSKDVPPSPEYNPYNADSPTYSPKSPVSKPAVAAIVESKQWQQPILPPTTNFHHPSRPYPGHPQFVPNPPVPRQHQNQQHHQHPQHPYYTPQPAPLQQQQPPYYNPNQQPLPQHPLPPQHPPYYNPNQYPPQYPPNFHPTRYNHNNNNHTSGNHHRNDDDEYSPPRRRRNNNNNNSNSSSNHAHKYRSTSPAAPQSWDEVENGAQVRVSETKDEKQLPQGQTKPEPTSEVDEDMVIIGHFQCPCRAAFTINHPAALTRSWRCKKCDRQLFALEAIGTQKAKYISDKRKVKTAMNEGWSGLRR
jgi:hypothetical protein